MPPQNQQPNGPQVYTPGTGVSGNQGGAPQNTPVVDNSASALNDLETPDTQSLDNTSPNALNIAQTGQAATTTVQQPTAPPKPRRRLLSKAVVITSIVMGSLLVVGLIALFVFRNREQQQQAAEIIPEQSVELAAETDSNLFDLATTTEDNKIIINGSIVGRNSLVLAGDDNTVARFSAEGLTGNFTYQLPNESGQICLDSNNCNFVTEDELTGTVTELQAGDGITINNQIISISQTVVTNDNGFLQGGNSFGATARLGTNDNQSLVLETNNTARVTINTSGELQIESGNLRTPDIFNLYVSSFTDPVLRAGNLLGAPIAVVNGALLVQQASGGGGGLIVYDNNDDAVLSVSPSARKTVFGTDTTTFIPGIVEIDDTLETTAGSCSFGCWGLLNNARVHADGNIGNFGGARMGYVTEDGSYTLTNGYGLNVVNATIGTGTNVTNNYGILVSAQTAGTNDFGVAIATADTQTLWLSNTANNTTANAGIAFGSSRDTNLYRGAANTLRTDDLFYAGGGITSPSGTNSERFGAGTVATGSASVALGYNATASTYDSAIAIGETATVGGTRSIAIGSLSSTGSADGLIAIGRQASNQSTTIGSLAIGRSSSINATSASGVAIGYQATINASSNGVAIGSGTSITGSSTVAVGTNATTGGFSAIALGNGANAAFQQSIAIGRDATTTAANQLVVGGGSNAISSAFFGNGVTNATPSAFTLNATGGSGTDIAGADITIAGGRGTGTGAGGSVAIQVAPGGVTGSSANSLSTVFEVDGTDGSALFQNASDSATGFTVVDSGGARLLNVDTTGNEVEFGQSSTTTGAIRIFRGSGGADSSTITMSGAQLQIASTNGGGSVYLSGQSNGVIVQNTVDSATGFRVRDSGGTNQLVVDTSTGAIQFSQYGAGTLETDASGNITASSDARLKNIQGNFTKGLDAIRGLTPSTYTWNDTSGLDQSRSYSGFIAQNVQGVIPEAISTDQRGYLTLSDRPILAASVNAIKELDTKVTLLEDRLTNLNQSQGALSIPNNLRVTSVSSSSVTTASLRVTGGAVFDGDISVAGDLRVSGRLLGNSLTRGQVTVKPATTEVTYSFAESFQRPPIVTLTATNAFAPAYRVKTTTNGFTVYLESPASEAITFNYHVQE